MQKGTIRVNTGNIFPIIKKFLYDEHEIFLRELVSNAVDATLKLKTISSLGELKGEIGNIDIKIVIDKDNNTLTISDKGIGMTASEIDKYLNQIAFSGAEEFIDKYKGQNENNIIGHFGLGFYSSFMVSDKVVVKSKSFKENETSVQWECDGSTEFSITETEKDQRGTDIILHLNDESKEFLESYRIKNILDKFCKFLPVPIFFEDKQINETEPLWIKKPSDLNDDDYKNFYKKLYPINETPLFWIHLNVDYPFNLTGILYFPLLKQSYEVQKDKISLYCNQVYVTDEVKSIVPEFLMLLHGVIDSPDIPLNVSRSYLQGDPNLKKINTYITKKVSEKLEELFNDNRKEFESKWDYINLFVKYGMMTDDKFFDKSQKFLILQDSVSGQNMTLDELRNETQALQTNKDKKLVVLYTTNSVEQNSYIQAASKKGYKVVKMETLIDTSFINQMELKLNDVEFKRVDSEILDNLIDNNSNEDSVLTKEEQDKVKNLFKIKIDNVNLNVHIKGLSSDEMPVVATQSEWIRRMKDMASVGGPETKFYSQMPNEINLTINGNSKVIRKILDEPNTEIQTIKARNMVDLALLSQGLLKGTNLSEFISRSFDSIG